MPGGPLSDLRVLDLTRLLPGPMCTLHLADMGARVIKVEDPRGGDYLRAMGEPPGTLFKLINRGKRSLCLDLKSDAGRERLLALCANTDVLIEGFRPGVMQRLGLGHEKIRQQFPSLIYCSLTGYGQTGPRATQAGHDINYLALTGVADQIGARHGPPELSNLQIADLLGGAASAALTILAAVIGRAQSGAGDYLDIAMADCTLAHNVAPTAAAFIGEVPERGADLLSGALPGYGYYRTADDRYMALGALEDKFWRRFCERVERPEWLAANVTDEPIAGRTRAEVAELFASQTRQDWVTFFAGCDCCVTPVLNVAEARGEGQFVARGLLRADGGFNFPVRALAGSALAPAPELGEHGDEILAELEHA